MILSIQPSVVNFIELPYSQVLKSKKSKFPSQKGLKIVEIYLAIDFILYKVVEWGTKCVKIVCKQTYYRYVSVKASMYVATTDPNNDLISTLCS